MAIEDKNINILPQGNIEENNTIIGTDSLGFAVGYTFKKLIAWITSELEKANLKKVEDVLTMAELRTKVGVAGQYKNLLGYYDAGDKPSLIYEWMDDNTGIEDDGGSSILVGNGYWKALFNEKNVKSFGAKGDGITDDYDSFQRFLDSMKSSEKVYIDEGIYKIGQTLKTKRGIHSISIEGVERKYSKLIFEVENCIEVHTEALNLHNLQFQGKNSSTGVMFEDFRNNGTADFDIYLENCAINNVSTLVKVKGRGVHLKNCNFYDMRGNLVVMDFPTRDEFKGDVYDIQSYENGFRGVTIEGCRIHYNRLYLVDNTGHHKMFLRGVTIINNWIEGNCGYIRGYAKDLIIDNNNHYQYEERPWEESEFSQFGCDNAVINIKITTLVKKDGYINNLFRLFTSTLPITNSNISIDVENVNEHLMWITGGCENTNINIIGNLLCKKGVNYSVIKFGSSMDIPIPIFSNIKIKLNLLNTICNYLIDTAGMTHSYIDVSSIFSTNPVFTNVQATDKNIFQEEYLQVGHQIDDYIKDFKNEIFTITIYEIEDSTGNVVGTHSKRAQSSVGSKTIILNKNKLTLKKEMLKIGHTYRAYINR